MPPSESADQRYLAQARDVMATYVRRTSEGYDNYLDHSWSDHRHHKDFRASWDENYNRMDDFLVNHGLRQAIEEQNLKWGELNLMLIGPGNTPVGNEIHQKTVDRWLKHLRTIVVVDFSTRVVRSAIEDLVAAGVPRTKLLGMQYDVSNGMSTAYEDIVSELLSTVESEEDLHRAMETFSRLTEEELQNRVHEAMHARRSSNTIDFQTDPEGSALPGGCVNSRTMRLETMTSATSPREPLPIHVANYSLVFAGTGAPTEARIWERFREVTSDPRWELPAGEDRDHLRRILRDNVHAGIQVLSGAVARLSPRRLIKDNHYPDSDVRVIGTSDVSTIYDDSGMRIRLNTDRVRRELAAEGIDVTVDQAGRWNDEPGHGHQVYTMVMKRLPNGSGIYKKKKVPTQDDPSNDDVITGDENSEENSSDAGTQS